MKRFKKTKKNLNNYDEYEQQVDETIPINQNDNSNSSRKFKKKSNYNCIYIFSILLFFICIIFLLFYLKIYYEEIKIIPDINKKRPTSTNLDKLNIFNKKNITLLDIPVKKGKINENKKHKRHKNLTTTILQEINNISKTTNTGEVKFGVAFVFKNLFGNGIGRMLSLLCSELAKLEKYDIYMITGAAIPSLDFEFDERVKMVRIAGNKTLI